MASFRVYKRLLAALVHYLAYKQPTEAQAEMADYVWQQKYVQFFKRHFELWENCEKSGPRCAYLQGLLEASEKKWDELRRAKTYPGPIRDRDVAAVAAAMETELCWIELHVVYDDWKTDLQQGAEVAHAA